MGSIQLICSTKELKKHVGKCMYVLYGKNGFVASSRKTDIDEYMKYEKIDAKRIISEEFVAIYGLVMDTTKMLFDIQEQMNIGVWLLKRYASENMEYDHLEECDDVASALLSIEEDYAEVFDEYKTDIDNICIIIGHVVDLILQIKTPGIVISMDLLSKTT